MKTGSDSLYNLIRSLTRNEKGYVTKTLRRDGAQANVYYQLFSLLGRMKEYDEKKVKDYFDSHFHKVSLSRIKNYTYERLLEILGQYNLDNVAEFRLQEYLRHIRILFDKALYKECHQRIRQAEKHARKYGYHLQLVELKRWEFELLIQNHDLRNNLGSGRAIIETLNESMEAFQEQLPYLSLHEELAIMMTSPRERFAKTASELAEKILDDPLLNKDESPRTVMSQYLDLRLRHLAHHLNGSPIEALQHARRLNELFQEYSWFAERFPNYHLRFLSNYCNILMINQQWTDMQEALDTLKAIKPRTDHNRNWQMALYHYLRIRYLIVSDRLEEVLAVEDEAMAFFKNSNNLATKSYLLVTRYNFGIAAFRLGAYKRAYLAFDEVRDDDKRFRTDLRYYSRLAQLLCLHLEGDTDHLEHRLRSLQYHWKKDEESITPLERALEKVLRSSLHTTEPTNVSAEGYQALVSALQNASTVREKWITEAVPFSEWMEKLESIQQELSGSRDLFRR